MGGQLSSTTSSKIDACRRAIALLEVDPQMISSRYTDSVFPKTTISKAMAFAELLRGSVSADLQGYLADVCDLRHHRDMRSSVDYGVDLMLGWIVEDAAAHRLRREGFDIRLSGHDRERVFLPAQQISQEPDLRVAGTGGDRRIEVMCDWKGTWRRYDHLDLRDNKYRQLQQHNAILLGISPVDGAGVVLECAADASGFKRNPAIRGCGNKPGYTLHGIKGMLRPLPVAFNDLLNLLR